MRPILSMLAISCVIGVTGAAAAGPVVAIVEEIDSGVSGVAPMEYLVTGQTISLGSSGRVIVGYLNSCLREEVVGGTVTIGTEQSVVKGGKVARNRVECDGGKLLLSAEQAGKSGTVVFRKGTMAQGAAATPSLLIFSLEPVIRIANRPSSATIERLDYPEMKFTVTLKNGVVDLASEERSLMRGGIYRVSGGGKARVFRVDPGAVRGGPLLSRYVAF